MASFGPSWREGDGTVAYCVLACLITWALAAPADLCFLARVPLPPLLLAAAGLSAFGPLIAALLTAAPRGQVRAMFRPWSTPPIWIVLALLAPLATHLAAIMLYGLLIGPPAQWLHPPLTPEHVAALVVFSIGEEFGWRGFLQPRLAARYGMVGGSLRVGVVWGMWHLAYSVTPETGNFDPVTLLLLLIKLPLWSVVIAWMMERARRSLAVALAVHAGGHVDNLQRALHVDLGLHGLHVLVLVLLAGVAARSLANTPRARATAPA